MVSVGRDTKYNESYEKRPTKIYLRATPGPGVRTEWLSFREVIGVALSLRWGFPSQPHAPSTLSRKATTGLPSGRAGEHSSLLLRYIS